MAVHNITVVIICDTTAASSYNFIDLNRSNWLVILKQDGAKMSNGVHSKKALRRQKKGESLHQSK